MIVRMFLEYFRTEWAGFIVRWLLIIVLVGVAFLGLLRVTAEYNDHAKNVSEQLQQLIYTASLPYKLAQLEREEVLLELLTPVYGVRVSQIDDTWGAPRSGGRTHEGTDIFAPTGTPTFSMTKGYVTQLGWGELGGWYVFVTGPGGLRYYYAHFDRLPEGLRVGSPVTTDTVVGFVGATGNAEGTPPHLHMGIYKRGEGAINPYPLLVDRDW